MNETLIQYRDRLTQYWKQSSRNQKIIFISSLILIVLTISLVVFQFSKTEYSNAFTDLNPNDAAAIKSYLDSNKIPYRLSADGKTMGVPTKQVASVKVDVESQGLLKNGSLGFGIFKENKSTFGMSDSEFNLLSVDARAGEIQKLINQMSGVNSSKVLLNMAQESVYAKPNKDQDMSSASVVVNFKPGYRIEQAQIDSIYNIVSKAVPKLPVENITVSGPDGELPASPKLGGSGVGTISSIVQENMQIRKNYELEIQRNAEKFLGTLFGRDKVIVSVFSTMNFDQKKSEQNLIQPSTPDNKGIAVSNQETQKSSNSDGGSVGGVTGTGQTDVPNYPATSNSGKSTYEEITRTTNYEINRIKNQIVSSPYVVKDLTISVGIEPPNPNDPNSLPPEQSALAKSFLTGIVSAALSDSGVTLTDPQLQSKVSIITRTFNGKSVMGQSSALNNTMLYGIGAAALALVGAGGYFLARRKRQAVVAAEEEAAAQAAAAKVEFPTIDIDAVNNDNQVRKQLEQLAKRKPEEFVNLLRTWLVDE